MKKYFLISVLVSLVFIKTAYSTFTISAEVERSFTLNRDIKIVRPYLEDLSIYEKFFPNMKSVKSKSDNESEWQYLVDYPLTKSFIVVFDQTKKVTNDTILTFESSDPSINYLFTNAVFSSLPRNQTSIKLNIKVKLTREKASDINIMGDILGENFISGKMKNELEDNVEKFIENIGRDLYSKKE